MISPSIRNLPFVVAIALFLLPTAAGGQIPTATGGQIPTAATAQGTWRPILRIELRHNAYMVGFLDGSLGLSVGPEGENHFTRDDGATWPSAVNSSRCLYGLDIVDSRIAWTCGNGGNVRFTVDGGKTWQAVKDFGRQSPNHVRHIRFLDAETGWVASLTGIGMTLDGGMTWAPVALPDGMREIAAMDLRSRDDACLLDTEGILHSTKDGGRTWTAVPLGLESGEKPLVDYSPVCAIRFTDSSRGVAVLGLASGTAKKFVVMRTENGGKTWSRTDLPVSVAYNDTVFLSHDGATLTHFHAAMDKPATVFRYR